MSQHKIIAAIHDLSGYGRCSLSVILPVISAMGIQVCPVPTAVMSTHTGGFTDIAMEDLFSHLRNRSIAVLNSFTETPTHLK